MDEYDLSPVKPLAERLAQLRPSAELLHFYRGKVHITYHTTFSRIFRSHTHRCDSLDNASKKNYLPNTPFQLAEYDTDRETMMDKLENFKGAADEQQSSQWQITQKEEELSALQKAISDLQVCLFQEREQVRAL